MGLFLRRHRRHKNGKDHSYWSIVENSRSPSGKVVAAVSVSGPLERLTRQPGRMHAPAVVAAAERLSQTLRRAS